jgi:hypothetical protein
LKLSSDGFTRAVRARCRELPQLNRVDGRDAPGHDVAAAKLEISFREMRRALKSLKTAKSRDFGIQQYQTLSNTHDFAGEAILFRFGKQGSRRLGAKIWKTPRIAKNPFSAA